MIRSSLLEVLNEDYIRTARAKGVFEKLVISRHALRNALLPAITVIGIEFAFLIGGLVVTEQVFNLNGIGMLFVQSVSRNDFTLIQAHGDADRRRSTWSSISSSTCSMRCSTRASGTPDVGRSPPRRSPRCRAGAARSLDFCRQQPLGAVSFVIIFVMMFAGIFAEWVAPYDPLDIDFAAHPGAALLGALGRHRRVSAATSSRASSTARAPRW